MSDKFYTRPQLFDRYREDVHFKKIVQQLLHFMTTADVQPYEVRDAAYVAETIYREQFVRPIAFHYQPIEERPNDQD